MNFMFLAVEDVLSETVGRKLVSAHLDRTIEINTLYGGGSGYLKSRIDKFVEIAQRAVLFLLTDLDSKECAPLLKTRWLGENEIPQRFMFRVCVREIESWILADREGFADFLGVSIAKLPTNVEGLADPKAELLRLARSAKRELRSELLPQKGSKSSQGLGYNNVLCRFVEDAWNGERASENSDSLRRARIRLEEARRFFT